MSINLEQKLAAGINLILEGRQTSPNGTKINKKHLRIYSEGDISGAFSVIKKWEQQNLLTILKNPTDASDDDFCIEMKRFVDQKSPIRGWLNWDA